MLVYRASALAQSRRLGGTQSRSIGLRLSKCPVCLLDGVRKPKRTYSALTSSVRGLRMRDCERLAAWSNSLTRELTIAVLVLLQSLWIHNALRNDSYMSDRKR